MSDYLSNLVARTLETAPLLQPRRLSLFEPVGGVWEMGSGEWGIGVEAETAISPQSQPVMPPPMPAATTEPGLPVAPMHPPLVTAAPSPTAVFHQPTAGLARQETAPPTQPTRPSEKPTIANHTTVPERTIVQQHIEQEIVRPPARPGAAGPPRRPVRSAATASGPVSANTAVASQVVPQLVPPVVPPVALPPPIKTMPSVIEQRPSAATPTETAKPEPLRPAASPPRSAVQLSPPQPAPHITPDGSRPVVAPPPPTRPMMPEQRVAVQESPAPAIHVTIGRIEVRATPPTPAKVEKRQPQTPAVSLDEYLRQRNGGRS